MQEEEVLSSSAPGMVQNLCVQFSTLPESVTLEIGQKQNAHKFELSDLGLPYFPLQPLKR
jgi:hypothetical protein